MKTIAEAFRPTPDALDRVSRVAERIEPDDENLAVWCRVYKSEHVERIAFDLEMIESAVSGNETIVDLASVPLLLVAALQEGQRKVFGVDIDPERFATSISELGLIVHECNIEQDQLPFADESVDVVVFNEIFEHLRIDLIATFREIRRILKPGGRVFLSTPNGLSLAHWARLFLKRKFGPDVFLEYQKLGRLGHMGHVREYCVNEVLDFLINMDFMPDYVCYRGRYGGKPKSMTTKIKYGVVNGVCALMPSVRPFFSVVAHKSDGDACSHKER